MNLAINARDAMPEGGELTIETRPIDLDAARTERHLGVRPGPFVELIVTDTGLGMTEEVSDDIFKPFFTTKPDGEGTGLGLATVHRIVSEAGGAIDVNSCVDAGTTFRLYFPAVEEPTA